MITKKKITPVRHELAKKFIDKHNEALLKDINYKDVVAGKKMLAEYNLGYFVSENGVIGIR